MMEKVIDTKHGYDDKRKNRANVIDPDSTAIVVWEIFIGFTIITYLFHIPLEIAFWQFSDDYDKSPRSSLFWYNVLMALLLTIDLFLYFNVAFYQKGELVCKRNAIIYQYTDSTLFVVKLLGLTAIACNGFFFSPPYLYLVLLFYFQIYTLYHLNGRFLDKL
jgi:hypothetical protein